MDIEEREWRSKAFCRDADPSIFFPGYLGSGRGSKGIRQEEESAIRDQYCCYCVVKTECLEYAITTNQREGVWGDTTSSERIVMIRARKQKRQKAMAS